jgi:hypothetical protein
MLLAAEDNKGNVGLLTTKSEPGDEVKFGNLKNSNKEISFDNFKKLKITAKNKKVYFDDLELKTDKDTVSYENIKDGKVC